MSSSPIYGICRKAVCRGLGLLLLAGPADRRMVAQIGIEVAIPIHLQDGDEYRLSVPELIRYGERVFAANWTVQEGAGRPFSKGTGNRLADPSAPLVFPRNFNRISAPDANSCAGCHNQPLTGGNGDIVANVFVTAQRFDFATFDASNVVPTGGAVDERGRDVTQQTIGNSRATLGMFGSGYVEMVARQMTAELQAIRDSTAPGASNRLETKGVSFGLIVRREDGAWDVSRVDGLAAPSLASAGPEDPPTLVVRPFHQAGNVVSLRQFSNNAFNHHHGMQSTERFGIDQDPDGDGHSNELTRADITAVSVFQAAMAVPGRIIPNDPQIEDAVLSGERLFTQIGCDDCHVPNLPLTDEGWVFSEPNPYNPPGNLRSNEAPELEVDLSSETLPRPRLKPIGGVVHVPMFTDLKLHDICSGPDDPNIEVIDMNEPGGSDGFFAGNRFFLTRKLWGVASKPNFFHHGQFTTMREAVLAHGGEAALSRDAFQALTESERNSVIEFLKTLRILPADAPGLFLDEHGKSKPWPPARFDQITRIGNHVRLRWRGDGGLYTPARVFQVQTSSDVVLPDWKDIGESTSGETVLLQATDARAFFRLQVRQGRALLQEGDADSIELER